MAMRFVRLETGSADDARQGQQHRLEGQRYRIDLPAPGHGDGQRCAQHDGGVEVEHGDGDRAHDPHAGAEVAPGGEAGGRGEDAEVVEQHGEGHGQQQEGDGFDEWTDGVPRVAWRQCAEGEGQHRSGDGEDPRRQPPRPGDRAGHADHEEGHSDGGHPAR